VPDRGEVGVRKHCDSMGTVPSAGLEAAVAVLLGAVLPGCACCARRLVCLLPSPDRPLSTHSRSCLRAATCSTLV
jgi:hypothetical protein